MYLLLNVTITMHIMHNAFHAIMIMPTIITLFYVQHYAFMKKGHVGSQLGYSANCVQSEMFHLCMQWNSVSQIAISF